MPDVTVLGLGRMGSALARAFSRNGHATVGWTRSPERRQGASSFCVPVATAEEAVSSSPLIVSCLADYAATTEALGAIPGDRWHGRTLVQLASGGPGDAVAMAEWAGARGALYLDGAIGTFPGRIGDAPTAIFLAGSSDAYGKHAGTLAALGGKVTFLGETVTAAATLDLAWLSLYYGVSIGMLNAAAFCAAGQVAPSRFFEAMPSFVPEITHAAREYDGMIAADTFTGDQATIDVHVAAMEHIAASARASGMDTRFTDLLLAVFGDAQRRGLGSLEIAASVQVLQGRAR